MISTEVNHATCALGEVKERRSTLEEPQRGVIRQLKSLELCPRCCDLVSRAILHRVDLASTEAPCSNFTTQDVLLASECRFCRYAGSIRKDHITFGGRVKRQSIYSLNPKYADYNMDSSRALLAFQTRYESNDRFVGDGTYGLLHLEFACDNLRPRLVNPRSVDFALVQEWLKFCQTHHTATCRLPQRQEVLGLKLIVDEISLVSLRNSRQM
jgi:hypothetical protein